MPYYIIFVFSIVGLGSASALTTQRLYKLLYASAAFLTIIFVAARKNTTDYWSYYNHIGDIQNNASSLAEAAGMFRDPGHGALIYLTDLFSPLFSVHAVFFVYALLGLLPLFWIYYRYCPMPFVAVIIFLCNNGLHINLAQMRSAAILSLMTVSLVLLYKNRRYLTSPLLPLAASLHPTGIALASSFWRPGPAATYGLLALLTLALLFSLAGGVGTFAMNYAVDILNYIGFELSSAHINTLFNEPRQLTLLFINVSFIFALLFLFKYNALRRVAPINSVFVPAYAIGCFCVLALQDTGSLSGRLFNVFTTGVEPVIWASLITLIRPRFYGTLLVLGYFLGKFILVTLLTERTYDNWFFVW